LSFMGTSSTSLPEDRSEWPSFLSGGSLPRVESVTISKDRSIPTLPFLSHINSNPNNNSIVTGVDATAEGSTTSYAYPRPISLSTSVPARMSSISTRSSLSAGPRMHDFLLPPGLGTDHSASTNLNIGVVAGSNENEQNAYSTSADAVPFRFPAPGSSSGPGLTQGWTSAIPSSSVRSGSSNSGSGSDSRSRSGSGSGSGLGLDWKAGSRSRSGSFELDVPVDADEDVEVPDKGDFEVAVEVVDTARTYTNVDINADDNGDERHAASAFVAPVRTPLPTSVGAYPYGYGQGQGAYGSYGSYGSYGAARSYGPGSSTTGVAAGRPGSFGDYPDARSFDPVRDTATGGGFASRARAISDARRDMSIVKLEEEDEDEGMVTGMKDDEESKVGMGRRRSRRKLSEVEAGRESRWDGMEMEVDMDMD